MDKLIPIVVAVALLGVGCMSYPGNQAMPDLGPLLAFKEGALWGYKTQSGDVAVKPQFIAAGENWSYGYAWVETRSCPDLLQEFCGNFIDSSGNLLLTNHVHSILSEPWMLNDEPVFREGFAFVRAMPDGGIMCIDMNGHPISLHKQLGLFEEYEWSLFRYRFIEGRAIVKVQDKGFGVINSDQMIILEPSKSITWLEAKRYAWPSMSNSQSSPTPNPPKQDWDSKDSYIMKSRTPEGTEKWEKSRGTERGGSPKVPIKPAESRE